MTQRILRIEELLALIPVSRPTIDRWTREAREGRGDFPIPFSEPGRRMLWDAHVVERWLENRNNATSPAAPPTKSAKQQAREFAARQEAARQTLEKHGINRKQEEGAA